MWKNNIKIGIRRLAIHKLNTLINVIGLSVGLTSFLLIFHIITFELSFDQFHNNKEEIYRIICHPNSDNKTPTIRNYKTLGLHVKEQFPEVKHLVRFWRPWNTNDGEALKAEDQIHYERNIIQSDPSFFEVFPSLLKNGDPKTVLSKPNTLVISASKAKAYFGDKDPIGLTVSDGTYDLEVTGIMYDVPENSHFTVDVVRTFTPYYVDFFQEEDWERLYLYTYFTINNTINIHSFQSKLESFIKSNGDQTSHLRKVSFELQPVIDIHLNSDLQGELAENTDKRVLIFLLCVGIIIIIMAWINYVNISLSSLFSRSKELTIREVIGATKFVLIRQLMTEYLLLNALALPITTCLILAAGNQLIQQDVVPVIDQGLYRPDLWPLAIGFLFIGSIIIGFIPLTLFKKLHSITVLIIRSNSTIFSGRLSSMMLMIQFIASLILISGVTIMSRQLNHLKSRESHLDVDQVISIRNPTTYANFESEKEHLNKLELFKEELHAIPNLSHVTSSSTIPGSPIGFSSTDGLRRSSQNKGELTPIKVIFADEEYLDVYSIPLLAGRSFSPTISQDIKEKSIMLSEETVRMLGFDSPESAIGEQVQYYMWAQWNDYEVVGVYKDYTHESAKFRPFPSIMYFNRNNEYVLHDQYYSVKFATGLPTKDMIEDLKSTWTTIWPDKPFEYQFVDQTYEFQYKTEKSMKSIFMLFSILAVLLACLGLLGMTHHELQLKLREISIRKVLGSTVTNIVRLMSAKYIRLILISTFMAIPMEFWLASEWLSSYPTRISLDLWIFLLPLVLLVLLVLATSGATVYNGANINPSKVLRGE